MRTPLVTALLALLLAGPAAPPAADAAGLGLKRCADRDTREAGFRCAMVTVPSDYANPAAGTMRVAVVVRRAASRRSLGPLFVNFGGPGGSTTETLPLFAGLLPAKVLERFDLVGVDPRGVGRSRPLIGCKVDQRKIGLYSFPVQKPGLDQAAYDARVQAYVDRCASRTGSRIAPYVGTANVARDMDRVRDLLGARKLTYLGFSYGTVLGATYLKLFPGNVRASVLDGAVDVDEWYNRPHDGLVGQTAGFEDALNRFLDAAAKRPGYARWIRGKDARASFDSLIAKANAKPLPSGIRGDRQRVTGDEVLNAVSGLLYAKQAWPQLNAMLREVRGGRGEAARTISDDGLGGRRKDGTYGPDLDRYFVISAADQPYADDPQQYLTWGAESTAAFPHFPYNVGFTEAHYGRWPFEGVGVDRGPFALPAETPESLVVGTTHDPATPYAAAQRLTAQLGRARLLTMDGDGHTAYAQGSACIDRRIRDYLLSVKLPAVGARCRQRLPFPPSGRSSAAAAQVAPHVLPYGSAWSAAASASSSAR